MISKSVRNDEFREEKFTRGQRFAHAAFYCLELGLGSQKTYLNGSLEARPAIVVRYEALAGIGSSAAILAATSHRDGHMQPHGRLWRDRDSR